jgi:hypothetical protein
MAVYTVQFTPSLLEMADLSPVTTPSGEEKPPETPPLSPPKSDSDTPRPPRHSPTLHYNIQIHLPATKDVEVFNSIFKSLREHLLE